MNSNPLDKPGIKFRLDLLNPNPTFSKTKTGPVHRVSFEVDSETWDLFRMANTKGMILTSVASVVPDMGESTGSSNGRTSGFESDNGGSKPSPVTKKPQTASQRAHLMCDHPNFWKYIEEKSEPPQLCKSYEDAERILKEVVGIKLKRELDSDEMARQVFEESVEKAYHQWSNP